MVEIKTDKKRIRVSDQEPTTDVTCVIYNTRDVASSQRSIKDPTAMT